MVAENEYLTQIPVREWSEIQRRLSALEKLVLSSTKTSPAQPIKPRDLPVNTMFRYAGDTAIYKRGPYSVMNLCTGGVDELHDIEDCEVIPLSPGETYTLVQI